MSNIIVVTRHKGLVDYLLAEGMITRGTKVVSHASEEDVRGKDVIGVLPLHLAAQAASVTEVPLALTPEMRGVELAEPDVRRVAGDPRTYIVRAV